MRIIKMCFFVAIGIKDEFVNSLSILGEHWECKNPSILEINNKLKWNCLIAFNAQCACDLFSITKDENDFIKMELLVRRTYSCIIVNHFYSGNQDNEQLILSSIKTMNIDNFKKLISIDQDILIKIVL
jgi:hypothetical protein